MGYRMAGCQLLAANEFVPAAQEVYKMNSSASTVMLNDDIREMKGDDFLKAVGLDVGELDIFDGSPPCASFSVAGKRSAEWGQVKKYSDTAQRTDDLFYEYARILKEIQPKAFVAENVEGLVRGESKGYFKMIYQELERCGYNVAASVLDASRLGVPQARKRLIFIGVRNDLKGTPRFPQPLPYRFTLADVLRQSDAKIARRNFAGNTISADRPSPTITTTPDEFWVLDKIINDKETNANLRQNWGDLQYGKIMRALLNEPRVKSRTYENTEVEPRRFNLQELRRICSFPDDFVLVGSYRQRWERLGRAVPPLMMKAIAQTVCEILDETQR